MVTGPLLVLGAGEEQLPLYHEARRRGLRTIAVDRRRDRPALAVADDFIQATTRDADAIATALGATRPAGVVSAASDACLLTWHELCERYDTPYRYPRAAALVGMDKVAFHGLMGHDRGWVRSADRTGLATAAQRLRFPLVCKPVDASGSKGVVRVATPADLPEAFDRAVGHTAEGTVLAEELLPGRQLVVEVFLRAGRPHFAAVVEKRFVPGTDFMVSGHVCPAPIEAKTFRRLVDTATALCDAMGITDGPADFDAVLTPEGEAHMIEVNARLGGNGIPRLVHAAWGLDTVAALISLALGEPFDLTPVRSRYAVSRLLGSPLDEDGELAEVSGADDARAIPGVTDVDVFGGPGDQVRPFTQSGHKIGHLVATGDTVAMAERAVERALQALHITIVPSIGLDAVPVPRGESDAHF